MMRKIPGFRLVPEPLDHEARDLPGFNLGDAELKKGAMLLESRPQSPPSKMARNGGCGTSLRARVQRGAQRDVWGSLGAQGDRLAGVEAGADASTTKGVRRSSGQS